MSKRILVVEDQEDNRQIIRDLLSATDYEITEAISGEEALVAVAKRRPDLILMDIQLPIMDGYEAAPGVADHHIVSYIGGSLVRAHRRRTEGAGSRLHRLRA